MDASSVADANVELPADMTAQERWRAAKAKVRETEEVLEQAAQKLKELNELRTEKDAERQCINDYAAKVKVQLRDVRNRCSSLTRRIGDLTRRRGELKEDRQAALRGLNCFRNWGCQRGCDMEKEIVASEQKLMFESLSAAEERECHAKIACLRREKLGMQVVDKFREAVHACDTMLHKARAERETMRAHMENLSDTHRLYSEELRKRMDASRAVVGQRAEAFKELRAAKDKSREALSMERLEQRQMQSEKQKKCWEEVLDEVQEELQVAMVQVMQYCERLLQQQAIVSSGGNDVDESTLYEKMCDTQDESIQLVRLPAKKTEEEDEEVMSCCSARGRRGRGRGRNRKGAVQASTIKHSAWSLHLFYQLGVNPPATMEDVHATLAAIRVRVYSDCAEQQ